jgi:hypothetical protein
MAFIADVDHRRLAPEIAEGGPTISGGEEADRPQHDGNKQERTS